jgi:hypothetical protein
VTCSITWRASGPCKTCGVRLNGMGDTLHAAHVTDDGLRCANCCPRCRQPDINWTGAPKTVEGDQVELFA